MKITVSLMAEESTHAEVEVTPEGLAMLQQIAKALNAAAEADGHPAAPWVQIDGQWTWPTA